jgi:hypothetical protein
VRIKKAIKPRKTIAQCIRKAPWEALQSLAHPNWERINSIMPFLFHSETRAHGKKEFFWWTSKYRKREKIL